MAPSPDTPCSEPCQDRFNDEAAEAERPALDLIECMYLYYKMQTYASLPKRFFSWIFETWEGFFVLEENVFIVTDLIVATI